MNSEWTFFLLAVAAHGEFLMKEFVRYGRMKAY